MRHLPLVLTILLLPLSAVGDIPSEHGWYTQGDFQPAQRVEIIVHNPLARERRNSPVTIRRDQLSVVPDVHEFAITLVDPSRSGRPEPSFELLQR